MNRDMVRAGLMALVLCQCSYYDETLLAAPQASTKPDASTGLCANAAPPAPPTNAQPGGDIQIDVAMSDIDFGEGDTSATHTYGYDVDRTCTSCQTGTPMSCVAEAWANGNHCDGLDGRDNAMGKFMADLSQAVGGSISSATWTNDIRRGRWSLLFRVRGYNGQPDDAQVELDWFVPDEFSSGLPAVDGGAPEPRWDGTDTWPVSDVSIDCADGGTCDLDHPRTFDKNAYVSGGILVGMVDASEIRAAGSLAMVVNHAYLTARLVQENNRWVMRDGTMSALWKLENVFAQMGTMSIAGVAMCKDNVIYGALKALICKHADIYPDINRPTASCDSLSMGMKFQTMPVVFGTIRHNGGPENKCLGEDDPSNDSCQ